MNLNLLKIVIFLAFITFINSNTCSGRGYLKYELGVGRSKLYGNEILDDQHSFRNCRRTGLTLELNILNDKHYLSIGGSYEITGSSFKVKDVIDMQGNITDVYGTETFRFYNVPIQYKYQFGSKTKIYFAGGFSLHFLKEAKEDYHLSGQKVIIDYTAEFDKTDLFFIASAGVRKSLNEKISINIEFQYTNSLNNLSTYPLYHSGKILLREYWVLIGISHKF